MKNPDLELCITRYAVVCATWQDLGGSHPVLAGFLAGWFSRVCGCQKPPKPEMYWDSFNLGWREADECISIINQRASK